MSGPKSYSAEVKDRHLKVFFRFLSEIETLWELLNNKSILDKKRNISISGADMTKPLKSLFDGISNPVVTPSGNILNQNEFDDFYNRIVQITDKQKFLIATLHEMLDDFGQIEDAYLHYLELETLALRYAKDFDDLKNQIVKNLQKTASSNPSAGLLINKVQQCYFTHPLPPFTIETAKNTESLEEAIRQSFEASQRAIIEAAKEIDRKEHSENTYQKVQLIGQPGIDINNSLSSHQKEIIEKIEFELYSISDEIALAKFSKRLNYLKLNFGNEMDFLLAELLDDIKSFKQQFQYRRILKKMLAKLKSATADAILVGDIGQLIEMITKTLEKEIIKTSDISRIKEFETAYNRKQSERTFKKLQKTAEGNFIKSRLIAALQTMNFEVVSDVEVIDFEQTSSFLLQIPEQKNYLNLRFDQSGKMLYNFVIPENRTDLSIDEINLKLAEMEEVCNEFKNMLTGLKNQGLNLDLTKEIEISEKALITLPGAIKSKVFAKRDLAAHSQHKKNSLQRQKRRNSS
jgi:hypothetical protein